MKRTALACLALFMATFAGFAQSSKQTAKQNDGANQSQALKEQIDLVKKQLPPSVQSIVGEAMPCYEYNEMQFTPVFKRKKDGQIFIANESFAMKDVIAYKGLGEKYNTPKKRKAFIETIKYMGLEKEFYNEYSDLCSTPYYIVLNAGSAQYNQEDNSFHFSFNADGQNGIDFGLIKLSSQYSKDGQIVLQENDKDKALEIENAKDNLSLLLLFTLDAYSSFNHNYFVANCNKICLYNRKSGYIYKECVEKKKEEETVKEQKLVEVPATFPGGEAAFLQYINKSTRYPARAMKMGVQGIVTVRFCISENGSVTDVTIKEGSHILLDNEAIRVIKGCPKWIPAREKGKPVPVWMNVPIRFGLR